MISLGTHLSPGYPEPLSHDLQSPPEPLSHKPHLTPSPSKSSPANPSANLSSELLFTEQTSSHALFLDEPTTGLDNAAAFFMVETLKHIVVDKCTSTQQNARPVTRLSTSWISSSPTKSSSISPA
ncbi:hypothetical protein ZIOFF_028261 [Zingiber officinale]|uniref:Uncharacterized protein n=1 Tax=Zingiber officinale TaxID=94328 RepID=A0A8J5LDP2_ZINOF|nr:hypothetical protein ZIOFF_028261 [Zingiber officinale]